MNSAHAVPRPDIPRFGRSTTGTGPEQLPEYELFVVQIFVISTWKAKWLKTKGHYATVLQS